MWFDLLITSCLLANPSHCDQQVMPVTRPLSQFECETLKGPLVIGWLNGLEGWFETRVQARFVIGAECSPHHEAAQ